MNFDNKSEDDLLKKAEASQQFNARFQEIQNALFDYLKWFEIGPDLIRSDDQSLSKMKWVEKNDTDVMMHIVRLGILLSHLRCVAQTWKSEDTQGTDYAYSVSQPEEPSRAITILYNIARGHALLYGRNYLTRDDLQIITNVVKSTAQIERVTIFSLLVANNGQLDTNEILESLNISPPTARRTMTEFKAVGLVTIEDVEFEGVGRPPLLMILKPEFRWILPDELKKKKVPYTPHIFEGNGDGKGEVIAWPIYMEMEQSERENADNFAISDKNIVNRELFCYKLMETGKLSRIEAEDIIDDLIKEGKLEQPLVGTLRRVQSK
jgi:DNA-binding transcriptional ArsR family regulator